ncbi:MAG TPA: hypothetical protein VK659_21940 [Asanoa sp.]|nr:hypothetical protein [Asanoa sp.]
MHQLTPPDVTTALVVAMKPLVVGSRLMGRNVDLSGVAKILEGFVDIVLGVSLTPKTVRMVLVEGEKGDGAIVDHDDFDVSSTESSATSAAADQVVAAVLGTQESAAEGGHVLKAIGVTWSDRVEAAALRDTLAARGIKDVMLVSELHAAGALAQAAGRAVGYESTGLLFIDRDTATLSVVRSDDGSIVKVLSRSLHSTDAMAVLADMVAAVEAQDSPPQGMFVVGSGVDIASVKSHLADLVGLPVNAPEESGLALARGAALAAANAPAFDATTAGLAYSQDPDGTTAGNAPVGLATAETQIAAVGAPAAVAWADDPDLDFDLPEPAEEGRKPFLLVGSALTSIFVLGVVGLVISLAVNIRPTADQRPDPGQAAIVPSAVPPAPPVEQAQPAAPPPPPAETIQAPIPVVQEAPAAPPRTVYVAPPEAAPAPAPEAPPPAPAAPPPDPLPAAPPPVIPPVIFPPIWQQPQYPQYPQYPQQRPWQPPWQQWPQRPPRDDGGDWPQSPQYPQNPQYPQYPQYPQQPQQPQEPQQPQWPWPPSGSGGSGGSGGSDGGSGGSHGSDGSSGGGGSGGGCFLIFCAPGGGGGGGGRH